MAAAHAAEKHGGQWSLIWWGIYTSISTWTKSQNLNAAEQACSLTISFCGIFFDNHQDHPNQYENNYKLHDEKEKRGTTPHPTPILVWKKVNGNWGNNISRISQWTKSCWRTYIRVRRKINKSKRAGPGITFRYLSWKVNNLIRSFKAKSYNRVHQVYQFHQNRLTSSYIGRQSFQTKINSQRDWLR